MNFKPFWDQKKISYSLKSCKTTTSNYSHLLLYSYCCFHCCNTIAILNSLIDMILVNSHIRYLSWKNDSASMLDFSNSQKMSKIGENEENYLMFIFLNLLGTQNWVLYTRIYHYLIIGTCFLFPRTCQAMNLKPWWGVEWVFPKWSVLVVYLIQGFFKNANFQLIFF